MDKNICFKYNLASYTKICDFLPYNERKLWLLFVLYFLLFISFLLLFTLFISFFALYFFPFCSFFNSPLYFLRSLLLYFSSLFHFYLLCLFFSASVFCICIGCPCAFVSHLERPNSADIVYQRQQVVNQIHFINHQNYNHILLFPSNFPFFDDDDKQCIMFHFVSHQNSSPIIKTTNMSSYFLT